MEKMFQTAWQMTSEHVQTRIFGAFTHILILQNWEKKVGIPYTSYIYNCSQTLTQVFYLEF